MIETSKIRLPGLVRLGLCLALGAAGLSCRHEAPADAPYPRTIPYSPALAEMVFEMGLWEHVVGVNDYARLDDTRRAVPRVGDMSPRLEPVLAVDPDLILIQQQSEDFARIAEADQSIRLAHFTIESLDDIPRAAREIGRLMGQEQVGRQAAQTFEDKIRGVRQRTKDLPTVRALFVLGTSRPSVPAEGTFIDDLIRLAGGVNAGRDIPGQGLWRNTRNELIVNARPEVLIVKAQPGKQQEARDWWLGRKEIPAAAAGRVYVVTDDRWVWPVLKQAQFAEALARMLHGLEGDS